MPWRLKSLIGVEQKENRRFACLNSRQNLLNANSRLPVILVIQD